MNTGDLIGTAAAVYELFTCEGGWPALFWLVLVIVFCVRFERSLGKMECNEENYEYLEDRKNDRKHRARS